MIQNQLWMFDGSEFICGRSSIKILMMKFFSTDLLRENLNNKFQEQIQKLDTNDPYYFSILEKLIEKYERDLPGID